MLELNKLEREFVASSRDASEREVTRARRTNRRLRGLLAAVAALLAVSVAGGLFAVIQRREARDAETAQIAQRLGAQALAEDDLDLSLLLAQQAVAIEDTPQTRSHLLAALARAPAVLGIMHGADDADLNDVALSPDGRTLAVLDLYAKILFFDTQTYEQIGAQLSAPRLLEALAYSPDGKTLAYAGGGLGNPYYLRLIDARTREQLAGASAFEEPAHLAFTTDGAHLVVMGVRSNGMSIRVFDAATLDRVGDPIGLPEFRGPAQFALTPDGRAVITASHTGELTWWDLLTGQKVRTLDTAPGPTALALSPDGRTVAVGNEKYIQLVDVGIGEVTLDDRRSARAPGLAAVQPRRPNPRVGRRRRDRDPLRCRVGDSPRHPARPRRRRAAGRLQPRWHHALHGQR